MLSMNRKQDTDSKNRHIKWAEYNNVEDRRSVCEFWRLSFPFLKCKIVKCVMRSVLEMLRVMEWCCCQCGEQYLMVSWASFRRWSVDTAVADAATEPPPTVGCCQLLPVSSASVPVMCACTRGPLSSIDHFAL